MFRKHVFSKHRKIPKWEFRKENIKHRGRIHNTWDRPATLWDGSATLWDAWKRSCPGGAFQVQVFHAQPKINHKNHTEAILSYRSYVLNCFETLHRQHFGRDPLTLWDESVTLWDGSATLWDGQVKGQRYATWRSCPPQNN